MYKLTLSYQTEEQPKQLRHRAKERRYFQTPPFFLVHSTMRKQRLPKAQDCWMDGQNEQGKYTFSNENVVTDLE